MEEASSKLSRDIIRIEGVSNQHSGQIRTLDTKSNGLETKTNNLEIKSKDLETKTKTLEEASSKLSRDITRVEGVSNQHSGQIRTLTTKSNGLETKSVTLERKTNTIETKGNRLEASLGSMTIAPLGTINAWITKPSTSASSRSLPNCKIIFS